MKFISSQILQPLFTQEFVLDKVSEGIEFPPVKNSETFGLYEPYNEKYRVHKLKSDFNFYESQFSYLTEI